MRRSTACAAPEEARRYAVLKTFELLERVRGLCASKISTRYEIVPHCACSQNGKDLAERGVMLCDNTQKLAPFAEDKAPNTNNICRLGP